jgi:hypothetical protein
MNPFTKNLRRIRWNLVILAALALPGVGAVLIAQAALKEAQQANRLASSKQKETQAKLVREREEEQELRDKFARYQDIAARGYIGNERRLEWVEQIRKINSERKLLDVQYELAPQQTLESLGSTGYSLMVSNMKLQMQLLHEDDLLNFLSDLRGSVQAYIRIRACNVERVARGAGGPATGSGSAQLKAECSLDWFTLQEKKEGKP